MKLSSVEDLVTVVCKFLRPDHMSNASVELGLFARKSSKNNVRNRNARCKENQTKETRRRTALHPDSRSPMNSGQLRQTRRDVWSGAALQRQVRAAIVEAVRRDHPAGLLHRQPSVVSANGRNSRVDRASRRAAGTPYTGALPLASGTRRTECRSATAARRMPGISIQRRAEMHRSNATS